MQPLIIAVIGALVLAVTFLAFRNRALARGQKIWMDLATSNTAVARQPMPPAAELIGMDRYHLATERLNKDIREAQAQRNEALKMLAVAQKARDEWQHKAEERGAAFAREVPEHADADRERQRLALDNRRLVHELRNTVN